MADADIDADENLFGKVVSDLQDEIAIDSSNVISGTLNYVDDYTGFSGDPELQQGHYLALHFAAPNYPNATITVTVTNPVTLDEDGIVVLYIRNKDSQTITVVANNGITSITKVYRLTGLTLEPEA